MASATIAKLYREAHKAQTGWRPGFAARDALDSARTIARWKALESIGAVQIGSEYDQDWEPDCDCDNPRCPDKNPESEAFGVIGQYRTDWDEREYWHMHDPDQWEHADSVWGFVGYRDVTSWKENPYVLGMMAETIRQFRDAWKVEVQRRRDLAAGLCPACHGTGRA